MWRTETGKEVGREGEKIIWCLYLRPREWVVNRAQGVFKECCQSLIASGLVLPGTELRVEHAWR